MALEEGSDARHCSEVFFLFFLFEGLFEKGAGRTMCGTPSHEGLGRDGDQL